MMLASLEAVKLDLRVGDEFSDADIERKIAIASGIIADYCKRDLSAFAEDGSSVDERPEVIEQATIEATRALYDGGDPLNDTVKALLHRQRDPAMA